MLPKWILISRGCFLGSRKTITNSFVLVKLYNRKAVTEHESHGSKMASTTIMKLRKRLDQGKLFSSFCVVFSLNSMLDYL